MSEVNLSSLSRHDASKILQKVEVELKSLLVLVAPCVIDGVEYQFKSEETFDFLIGIMGEIQRAIRKLQVQQSITTVGTQTQETKPIKPSKPIRRKLQATSIELAAKDESQFPNLYDDSVLEPADELDLKLGRLEFLPVHEKREKETEKEKEEKENNNEEKETEKEKEEKENNNEEKETEKEKEEKENNNEEKEIEKEKEEKENNNDEKEIEKEKEEKENNNEEIKNEKEKIEQENEKEEIKKEEIKNGKEEIKNGKEEIENEKEEIENGKEEIKNGKEEIEHKEEMKTIKEEKENNNQEKENEKENNHQEKENNNQEQELENRKQQNKDSTLDGINNGQFVTISSKGSNTVTINEAAKERNVFVTPGTQPETNPIKPIKPIRRKLLEAREAMAREAMAREAKAKEATAIESAARVDKPSVEYYYAMGMHLIYGNYHLLPQGDYIYPPEVEQEDDHSHSDNIATNVIMEKSSKKTKGNKLRQIRQAFSRLRRRIARPFLQCVEHYTQSS